MLAGGKWGRKAGPDRCAEEFELDPKINVSPGAGIQIHDHKDVKRYDYWDFPGGPVVKTPSFQCRGPRFDPWSGN